MRTQKELDNLESHIPTLANSETRKAYLACFRFECYKSYKKQNI